jgi:hypothetical protein
MAYTPEVFNRYKQIVDTSCSHVARSIMHLLKPDDNYPKYDEDTIKERYTLWQTDCRAMDAACNVSWHASKQDEMIKMPPDDKEHLPCRMMAAVIIERNIYGEFVAQENLTEAVKLIRANMDVYTLHPPTCACHFSEGWTYANDKLVKDLVKDLYISYSTIKKTHVAKCACGECHRARVLNGTADAYMRACQEDSDKVLSTIASQLGADMAISAARAMPTGETDDGFIKNLFKTVQGVNFDDKCPHDLPYYACMSCSH